MSLASAVIRVSSRNQRKHQHRLFVGAQGPGVLAGPATDPFVVQQAGQEQHAVLGHVQDGLVCDTHRGAGLQL